LQHRIAIHPTLEPFAWSIALESFFRIDQTECGIFLWKQHNALDVVNALDEFLTVSQLVTENQHRKRNAPQIVKRMFIVKCKVQEQ